MKKIIKNLNIVLKYNSNTLIKYQLLSKLIISLLFISLFNLKLNPIIIILLFIINIFDILSFIIILNESYYKKEINLLDTIKTSFTKLLSLFNTKNIFIIPLLILFIPFINCGMLFNLLSTVTFSENTINYLNNYIYIPIIISLLYIVIILILSKLIYTINYMIIDNKTFNESKKLSKRITNHSIKDLIIIFLIQLLLSIIFILSILLISLIIKNNKTLWIFITILLILFNIISNTISYGLINILFYKKKYTNNEDIPIINYKEKDNNKIIKTIIMLFYLFIICITLIYTYKIITYKILIEPSKNTKITAHRGGSLKYPENTMAAFKGAIEDKVDYIEFDVHQTKDKQLVISHDYNLSRVAKVKKNIIDMTYDEIQKIDVGSHFNTYYKDERMPLLSDVLKLASENDIMLNVELKPTGKEKDFEKSVINLIKEYHLENKCVVTSQNYNTVKNIKKIDDSITTVFVTNNYKGNILDYDKANHYSIEQSKINYDLVKTIHEANKEIYAWTINDEVGVYKMLELNVDNIITDDVDLVKSILKDEKNYNLLKELIIKR